jgi:hypothetical protein
MQIVQKAAAYHRKEMGIVGATSEAERDCGTLEEGQSHMGALRISVLQVMTLICYNYTELKGRGEEEKERGGWERRRRDEAMRGVEVRRKENSRGEES